MNQRFFGAAVQEQATVLPLEERATTMVPIGLGHQEPSGLPRLIWADLVFRAPQGKTRSKVATKETEKCDRNMAAASKLHLESKGCRLGKKNGKTRLFHLCLDGIQEAEAKGRRESPPPKFLTVNPSLSTPGNVATPEKCAVKKILVDLRPILDNVTYPLDSWQEEVLQRDPRNHGHPSPNTGDSSGADLTEGGEDRTTKMIAAEGGGDIAAEMTTVCSRDDEDIHEDIPLPPTADPVGASNSDAKSTAKTPKGTQSQLGESMQLQKNNSPAVLTLEPQFKTPVVLPKITPQRRALLEAESSTEPPTAPSPDFQLPTQLLLQRLQETTTSRNHLLITQVLSSLRAELLVPSPRSAHGEKQNSFPELPRIKAQKSGTADCRRKKPNAGLEAAKRRLSKFTWNRDRSVCGAGVEQAPPDLCMATALRAKCLAGLDPAHAAS